MESNKHKVPIQSTAGAIPLKNEKGQVYMEKVKVSRYVAGKRPEFAPDSSDEDEDVEFGLKQSKVTETLPSTIDIDVDDRRLRRLQERQQQQEEEEDEDEDEEERLKRRRRLHEPEVLAGSSDEEGEASDSSEGARARRVPQRMEQSSEEEEEEEEELEEEEIERRRALLRQRVKQQQHQEEEVLELEEEGEEVSDADKESSSEYEEYTDSEEEDTGPRLKPVFVRKKDRVTIQEKEREEIRLRQAEAEVKRVVEQRRRQTLKIVEDEVKKELKGDKEVKEDCDGVDSGDENDEEEYEAWKVRELKRIKRERDERDTLEKDRVEVERLRNMTEEERHQEQKQNPKQVTNKASKGKYKFLQKYYHRGAFFLDEEENVFKRDFSSPTLDDHFDKTVLPKVMQVKNFGRSGRTKYTHLVDQDTTQFDSPWTDTTTNLKFHTSKGGGMKQVFERPTTKKRK